MPYTDPYLEAIQNLGTLIHVKKHECLHNRAHTDHYVYCLQEGLCALHSVSPNGKERIYQYFQPGDLIGFIPAYIRDYPDETFYAFSITAKSACTLYQIPYATFRNYIDSHPEFYRWLFQVTVSHYDNAFRHCYVLQDGDNMVSLCHALAELAVKEGNRYVIHKDFSYPELANYLGIHTITVTRLMARLKEEGIISKEGHVTIVHDMGKLIFMSQEESL